MNKKNSLRILHCPDIVGGNAPELARAERRLGLCSKSVAFEQSYIGYKADQILLSPGANRFIKELMRWKLLWIALSYDIIHYNFGQTIMPSKLSLTGAQARQLSFVSKIFYKLYVSCFEFLDVRILKSLGKKLIVTFQGDDARQGDYCREHFAITFARNVGSDYYNPESDKIKRERIKFFTKHADAIFSLNPDLLRVLPPNSKFLPYSSVNLCDWQPVKIANHMPLIVHAPSHKAVKGTSFIIEAVANLHKKGLKFNFQLVEGVSITEARKIYEKADLLIDQLLAGWYGGLAVELMALGKPVICYLREDDLKFIPQEMQAEIPIINAKPESIQNVLEHWLTSGFSQLPEVGRKSRQYVERWHDADRIAAELKQEYETLMSSRG